MEETQEFKQVYIPKWGFTKAVTPCFYSCCPHNATVVEGGKISGAGVCTLGLQTGKYKSLTDCEDRWDRKEHEDFLDSYSKIPRDVFEETGRRFPY